MQINNKIVDKQPKKVTIKHQLEQLKHNFFKPLKITFITNKNQLNSI